MKDRAVEILDLASSHPPTRWLTLADIVQMIRHLCPGPRTADAYARELVWELSQQGLFERSARRDLYRITSLGRKFIEAQRLESEVSR